MARRGVSTMAGTDEQIFERIATLMDDVDELIDNDDLEGARRTLIEALELVPEPKSSYTQATWLYAALADVYFFAEEYALSLVALIDAISCKDGEENSFIHLRMGECEFELGNLDRAFEHFGRAHRIDGDDLFEEEDSKYFDFYRSRIKH